MISPLTVAHDGVVRHAYGKLERFCHDGYAMVMKLPRFV